MSPRRFTSPKSKSFAPLLAQSSSDISTNSRRSVKHDSRRRKKRLPRDELSRRRDVRLKKRSARLKKLPRRLRIQR